MGSPLLTDNTCRDFIQRLINFVEIIDFEVGMDFVILCEFPVENDNF